MVDRVTETHRKAMSYHYHQYSQILGFDEETRPELAFASLQSRTTQAACTPDAKKIKFGPLCEEKFDQDKGVSLKFTIAHELSHVALLRSSYFATGHADIFLAVYGLALDSLGIPQVESCVADCAKRNWPNDVPKALRIVHQRRAIRLRKLLNINQSQLQSLSLRELAGRVVNIAKQELLPRDGACRDMWTDYLSDRGKRGASNLLKGVCRSLQGLIQVGVNPVLETRLKKLSRHRCTLKAE